MGTFRRRFRGRRRSRLMPETYTIFQCNQCSNMWRTMPCGGACVTAICLMDMSLARAPTSDTTEIAAPSDRHVIVDAIKFQSEHSTDPATWLGSTAFEVSVNNLAFFQFLWEMVVVLPKTFGATQIPAYLIDPTGPAQSGDIAERVLWKRLSIMPMWGLTVSNGFPQFQTTVRDQGHGPVAVKSKVKLDDRHALYYLRAFHNDLFGLPDCTQYGIHDCTFRPDTDPFPNQVIPLLWDANFKIFYHTTKR